MGEPDMVSFNAVLLPFLPPNRASLRSVPYRSMSHRPAPAAPPPPPGHRHAPRLRDITVEDVKNDPALRDALRKLRAKHLEQTGFYVPQMKEYYANSNKPYAHLREAPQLLPRRDADAIRTSITPTQISRDGKLRESLITLRARTNYLNWRAAKQQAANQREIDAKRFSLVGTVPAWRKVPNAGRAPAGKAYIASLGNGWIGPPQVMESYRRPRGPANI